MQKTFSILLLSATITGVSSVGIAAASSVNQVSYGSLTGSEVVTFEDLPQISAPGTNYDNIFVSGGVSFAERFVGQTLSTLNNFDQLSGSPNAGLALQIGAANQNINVFAGNYNGKYGNVLDGLGPIGYPSYDAIGEGSFALRFSTDQSQFGFSLVGGDGGNAYISFFKRDGSLIDSITVSGLSNTYYGFSREGGVMDIAGISIYNDDLGGVAFDDLKHDVRSNENNSVPEPASMALLGIGIAGLFAFRERKMK